MGDNNQVKIDITAEVQGFNANMASAQANLERLAGAFDKTGAATRAYTQHSDAAEGMTNKLANATSNLTGLVTQAAAAFGLYKLYEYAKDAALLNARYETLGISMTVVGKNAGYNAAQMDDAALSMQKTGISMVESRQQAMRLVQAHIDLTQSTKLARIAQDAAVIGNMNSSEAFAHMIHGIQTGQTDVLRTIGLNISMEQSYKLMAQQLHKNVDSLTQNEKTQAILNAVLLAGTDIAGTYEAAMGTAGKQLNSMTRYTEDLKVKQGEVFNELLTVAVMAYTEHLKAANGELDEMAKNGQIKAWAEGVTDTIVTLADVANRAIGMLQILGKTGALLATYASVGAISKAGQAATAAYAEDIKEIEEGSGKFMRALDKRRTAQAEQYADSEAAAKAHGEQMNGIMKFYADQLTQGAITEAAYLKTVSAVMDSEFGDKHKFKDTASTKNGNAAADFLQKLKEDALKIGQFGKDGEFIKLDKYQQLYEHAKHLGIDPAQAAKSIENLHKIEDAEAGYVAKSEAKQRSIDNEIERLNRLEMAKTDAYEAGNKLTRSRDDEIAQIQLETSMIGKSAIERKSAIEAQKFDLDIRKQSLQIWPEYRDEFIKTADVVRDKYITAIEDADRASRSFASGMSSALGAYQDEVTNTAAQTGRVLTNSFHNLEDVFVKTFTTGKFAASDFFASLEADMARMYTQREITGPLFKALFGAGAGGGMAGQFTEQLNVGFEYGINPFSDQASQLAAQSAGLHHTGYGPGDSINGRYVHPAYFEDAPRFHTGIGAGERPAIIRNDEAVLTPGQMRMLAPAGGGMQSLRVEIVNNGSAPQQVVSAQPSFDGKGMVVSIVLDDLKRGGPISGGIKNLTQPGY